MARLNVQATKPKEWTCAQCSNRTSLPVSRCPLCDAPLHGVERTWTATRHDPRIQVPTGVPGEVNGSLAVRLVDLSSRGARLEHGDILRPGQPCLLSLPLGFAARSLHLPSRVVWSQVRHIEPKEGIAYHSGLEFQALPADVRQDLGEYLGRVAGSLPGPLRALMAPPSDSPPTLPGSAL